MTYDSDSYVRMATFAHTSTSNLGTDLLIACMDERMKGRTNEWKMDKADRQRKTDRQTDRETDRQTDRQTDR